MNAFNHNRYIWQHADWPNFKWQADALLEPLSDLSGLHGMLNGRMSMLGFRDKSRAFVNAIADDLIGSSEIEGIKLNADSVRSSIARRLGIEHDGLLVEDHYVEGLVDVMFDAITHNDENLTEERMFGWHAALFPTGRSGMYKITVADWRKGDEPMQVVSGSPGKETVHYEAVPSDMVPVEMSRFMDWCNRTIDLSPFVMAAVAHLWFVSIHPFDDGNGRISRTLTDMLLARIDSGNVRYYSMSAEINRHKKSYYEVLERTQKGDLDITEWLLWFFDCLKSAITRALEVIGKTLEKAEYWNRFCDIVINERQRKVINRLWDGFDGKLTTSKWAKICSCSQDTALRDINYLVDRNMLRKSDDGGRNANYLLP